MDILVTRRLTLRPPLDVDAEAITAGLQDHNVSRMLSNVPNPYTVDEANKWIKKTQASKDDLYFCIYRHKFLGVVHVRIDQEGHPNLGYWLERSGWGQGFMSEAARAAVSHAFRKFGHDHIISGAYEDNRASMTILEKLGFEQHKAIVDHNPTRKCDVTCNKVILTRERFESLFGSLESSAAA